MADGVVTAAWAGLRAALVADATLAALVPAERVRDYVPEGFDLFPYIRLGQVEPAADDTDSTTGFLLQLGLECFSRPAFGRMEVARICEAIQVALHRRPDLVAVQGFDLIEIEVQTWAVTQAADGVTWRGVVALQLRLEK